MPKIQCHIGKVKLSGLGGMRNHLMHRERSRSNPDIDHTMTKDNYSLIDGKNLVRFVYKKIKMEVTRKVRPDAVGLVDVVCGASVEYMRNLSPDQQRAFFQGCLSFLSARYGPENIVYAMVHMDETNPHIHIGIVPIRDGRLSAKMIFNPVELRQLQDNIAAEVGRMWNLERGEIGSGGRRYKELQDFKRECKFHEVEPDLRAHEAFERARSAAEYARKMGGLVEDREHVVMPTREWKRLAELAQRTAQAEEDRFTERKGRLAAEKALREAERERQRLAEEIDRAARMQRKKPDELERIPQRYIPMIEELVDRERQRIRDAGDNMNRSICKTFLETGKDFRQTVAIAAPVLESFGIQQEQHGAYIRECLRAVSLQVAKRKHGGRVSCRRGQRWTPQPKETDYSKETSLPVGNLSKWQEDDFISWDLLDDFWRKEITSKQVDRLI